MSRRKIYYENIAVIGEEEWLWSGNFNALYKRKRNSGKIERVGEYKGCERPAYSKIVVYKKKIIGLPFSADKIFVYDMLKAEFRYVDIGICGIETERGHLNKFYGAVTNKNLLYMIGCNTAYILVFDMEKETVENYVDLSPFIDEDEKTDRGYMREAILYDNRLLATATYDNFVFEINLDDLQVTKRKIERCGKGFSAIYKLDTQIWLLPFDEGEIVVWDIAKKTMIRHYVEQYFTFVREQRNFLFATMKNEKIWLFPVVGSAVLSYDIKTRTFSNQNDINRYFENIQKTPKFAAADVCGKDIILFAAEIHENLIFDTQNNKICLEKYDISAMELLTILEKKEEKIVSETEFSLMDYLDFVNGKKEIKQVQEEKRCGKKIYDTILEKL